MNRLSIHLMEKQQIDFAFDKLSTGTYCVEVIIKEEHKEITKIVFFMNEAEYLKMGSKMSDYGHFMVMQQD